MPKASKRVKKLSARSPRSARTATAARTTKKAARTKESAAPRSGTRLYDAAALKALGKQLGRWQGETLNPSMAKMKNRRPAFQTDSGVPIPDLLTAVDRA